MKALALFAILAVGLAVIVWAIIRAIRLERLGPFLSRDEMLGDLPNVPRLTNPVRVDAFHARSNER